MSGMKTITWVAFAWSAIAIPVSLGLAAEQVWTVGFELSRVATLVVYLSFFLFGVSLFLLNSKKEKRSVFSGLPRPFIIATLVLAVVVLLSGVVLVLNPPQRPINFNLTLQLLTASLLYLVAAGGYWSELSGSK